MNMNDSRANTRRRAQHASASSSAAPENSSGFSFTKSIHNINVGRKRAHGESKSRRHYIRRKGKNISRVKLMFSKLGKLRIIDVVLCVGVVSKIASMLYTHCTKSSLISVQRMDPPTLEPRSPDEEDESSSHNWLPPKWLKSWVEHKMSFHSPLLYRREDDDYSFGHDSYLDDEENDHDNKQKKRLRFKGMFQADWHFSDYKEQLEGHGYAVVDDVLYNAEDYRETTQQALNYSDFQVNPVSDEFTVDYLHPAFEFADDEDEHRHYITDDVGWDHYYAFDDDKIRGTLGLGLSEKEDDEIEEDVCTRPSFYRTYHPTCNEMHASLSGYQWLVGEELYSRRWKQKKQLSSDTSHLNKYLSHGYYRDAFLFQPTVVSHDEKGNPSTKWDEVVFKTMRHMYASETGELEEDDEIEPVGMAFDPEDLYTFLQYQEDMRKDAMVMELLSSSPRAINIYSHCSMSSVIEFAPTDIEEYILPTTGYSPKTFVRRGAKNNELDEPLNDFIPAEEKLEIALEMAKCLAAMHGYEDGVIAHVDVQVGQFFRGRDGLIKFVDYNRAEPLLYDTKNGHYCKWTNGRPADGVYRAPEENVDAPLTEQIDVFSLGNVFYSLLTGKLVWEEYEREERIHRIVEGSNLPIPEIYNESSASSSLVRAIKACWTYDAEARPSIFEVVGFLEREVAAQSNEHNRPPERKRSVG